MRCAGRIAALVLACALALAGPAAAQGTSGASVGDLRAELTLLGNQIRQLRDALVAEGAPRGLPREAATPLERVDQLEAELRRITARVEVLSNELSQVVTAATNRVGEIEFRLTELEGGDTSLLGAPEPPLGGGITVIPSPMPAPRAQTGEIARAVPPVQTGEAQLTVTEQGDFDRAVAAAEAGNHAEAAELFDTFMRTYPGGPLSGEARFLRGEALAAQGDWQGAARSFLDAFSGAPEGPRAPRALYLLAVSLSEIGKTDEACLTLDEVDSRYPGSDVAAEVALQRETLSCT